MPINWTEDCLACQAEHNGTCKSAACARHFYDPWGDPYPDWVYHLDGNNVQEYIEAKRKRLEA